MSDLVITRRRKKYKFAKFNELPNCFQFEGWLREACHPELVSGSRKESITWILKQVQDDNNRKLILEIGAGSALFLVELAKLHPENFYIAIDIKSDRLYRGARKANDEKIKNIVFVRSDIWRINEILPENSVDEIWLTFPDPYPKKSDARHRLTHPRFLKMYKTILRKGPTLTQLRFKTDNGGLFDWSIEQFKQNGWQTKEISRDLHSSSLSDEYKITTTYEQKFLNEGLSIFFASFVIELE